MITAKRSSEDVSVGAMLGVTNDPFFAIADIDLPNGIQVVTYMVNAYDAERKQR